jgi:PPOX class probable F420-dependent enzyme
MGMDGDEMRRRVETANVMRVGTVDERGRVHLVPIVFAIERDTVYSSTDDDPPPKRLRNLERNPEVSLLVDSYNDDWSNVWWVRMRGTGRAIAGGPERDHARRLLTEKYPQFEGDPGGGPIIAVDVEKCSGWTYAG